MGRRRQVCFRFVVGQGGTALGQSTVTGQITTWKWQSGFRGCHPVESCHTKYEEYMNNMFNINIVRLVVIMLITIFIIVVINNNDNTNTVVIVITALRILPRGKNIDWQLRMAVSNSKVVSCKCAAMYINMCGSCNEFCVAAKACSTFR